MFRTIADLVAYANRHGECVAIEDEDLIRAMLLPDEQRLIQIAGTKLDVAQPTSMGGLWVGQAATVTGSDAAHDVVGDFTGTTQTIQGSPSVAAPVVAAHSGTDGSTFKVAIEGIWIAGAAVMHQTASSARVAIGVDNVLGDLSIDPAATTRTWDVKTSISAGADTVPIACVTPPIVIPRDVAMDPTLGLFRLLQSNNAGAGMADTSVLVAQTQFRLYRLGNIPRAVA